MGLRAVRDAARGGRWCSSRRTCWCRCSSRCSRSLTRTTVERIHALVNRAGAPVRDVCSLDFSRRTAEANAAVIGLGRSRRVVIADTSAGRVHAGRSRRRRRARAGSPRASRRAALAARPRRIDVAGSGRRRRGSGGRAARAEPAQPGVRPGYPVLFFVVELYFLLASPLLNWWSRRLGDARRPLCAAARRATRRHLRAAMRRIGCQNLVELRPPRWSEVLLATHPALHRRMQMAQSWGA